MLRESSERMSWLSSVGDEAVIESTVQEVELRAVGTWQIQGCDVQPTWHYLRNGRWTLTGGKAGHFHMIR